MKGDLTANNFIVGSTNLITELNTKQDLILDGSLAISKTNGLQDALNETAKVASANIFTALQTIVGDLKADYVLVKNTTPTLTTHLTSKLYVDSQVNLTAKLTSANTFTANQTITGNLNVSGIITLAGENVNTTLSSILARLDALET